MHAKMFTSLMLAASLSGLALPLLAQTRFVLDPTFGDRGVATFEWPIAMGYQWNATEVWATKLVNGKWAVATQLRSGNGQTTQVNWFEPDGSVTPASPGNGPYTPFGRGGWNGAGIATSDDGAFTLLSTIQLSSNNTDFQLYRSWQDGGDGYTGCAGTFFNNLSVDMAPPNFMQDFARGLVVDSKGRMIVAGTARAGENDTRIVVTRARADCFLDSSFGAHNGRAIINVPGAASVRVHAAVLDSQSRILIGGGYTLGSGPDPDGRCFVTRLSADGRLDTAFGDDGFVLIDNFTHREGSWRCDFRHMALDGGNRIYPRGDYTLTDGGQSWQSTARLRIRSNGLVDWDFAPGTHLDDGADYRGGGSVVLHLDDRYISAVTRVRHTGSGAQRAESWLSAGRMLDGSLPPGPDFLSPTTPPASMTGSVTYHRIVKDGLDMFYVLATSGPDSLTHHKTHMLRYRRESTIPKEPTDIIFRNGFQTP